MNSVTTEITRGANTETYVQSTTYDQYGRVFQKFDGAGPGTGLEYAYNTYGYLSSAKESKNSAEVTETYYQINAMDHRGNVTQLYKGGVTVNHTFDPATGRPTDIESENAAFETLQDLNLQFDILGNLTSKQDQSRTEGGGSKNLTELYSYDGLNRLDTVTLNGTMTLDLGYDALGNITSKQAWTPGGSTDANSNVGSYSYGTKPHAVTSAGGASYTYDANGSMISGDGRTISYGVHNKPTYFGRGASTLHVYYGPNRNRYKRIDDVSDPNEKETHYVGNIERIYSASQTITKRYLDGEVIATRTEASSAITEEVAYLLKDHLGSTHMIVDGAGSIVQGMSFDPYGRRRADTSFASLTDTQIFLFDTSETTKGYTGHEGLDPIGLIHMNGRVFDPTLGRFLSADPYIQSSANTQNFNRYSYVLNNPMSYSDPSGHFFVSLFATAVLAKAGVDTAVAAVLVMGAAGAADALIQGANFFEAFRSGFLQGATAGAFTAIGAGAKLANMSWPQAAKMGLAYGSVGGISSVLQGGKFGHGFLSAGVNPFLGKGLSGTIGRQIGSGGRTMVQLVAAGTISEATGGKFANGASYAAFAAGIEGVFGRTLERDHQRGHPPSDGIKIPSSELAAALEESYEAVDEALYGVVDFATEDAAAWYLHDRLFPISEKYGIEIGARIYNTERGGRWRITSPTSQGISNRVWQDPPPPSALGGTAGAWHSHPSGDLPNHWDFDNVTSPDRFPKRSFVSHRYNGRSVLSGAGASSRSFEMLER